MSKTLEPNLWEEHDELFHYTTGEGLLGILSTQTLWATHYKKLNDTQEYIHFKNFLQDYIADKALTKLGFNFVDAQNYSNGICTTIYKHLDKDQALVQPFITSFASHSDPYEKENGLLSQWRGYTDQMGVAIVFDTHELCIQMRKYIGHFQRCVGDATTIIYDHEKARIDNFIKPHCHPISRWPELALDQKEDAIRQFIRCAIRYKHQAFKEEQEVRFVTIVLDKPDITVDYRGSNESPIPYVKLFEGMNIELPIKRIIVGPSAEKIERAEKLKTYLSENTAYDPEIVKVSKTPLV